MNKAIIGLTIALLLGTSGAAPAAQQPPTEIVVTGTGSLTMQPNVATVSAAISTTSANSADAASQNNAIYQRVIGSLSKLKVARDDIALESYRINYNPKPKIVPPPPNAEIYGYTVWRTFAVKVRAMNDAGSVVDALTHAGVTQIYNVAFGLANDEAARAKALTLAVGDARGKATALAAASHLHLIGIKSISTEQGAFAPIAMKTMAAVSPVATQFDPSNVNVSVSVSIVYLAAP